MLEDDTITATKRTIAATLEARHYNGNREKKGHDSQDRKRKHEQKDPGRADITTHLKGLKNEPIRIRGEIAALNRHDSCCHLLSSSQPFNLFKGSSGLKLRGVIQKEETNLGIASITRTSKIEPMNVTGFEGY